MEATTSPVVDLSERKYMVIRFTLFWCALTVVSSVYVTTPLLDTLATEYHVTKEMASWTSNAFSLFYAIGFLIFGPISDRFGCKQVILFGLGALSIVTFSIGFTESFTLMVALRGVQGFFASTFAPTALTYIFKTFPQAKRTTTVGLISFGYVLAGLYGQIVADMITTYYRFQMVFFLFGFLYVLSLLIVYMWLPKTDKDTARINLNHYWENIKVVLKRQDILLSYLITLLLLLTFIGMYTVLADFLDMSELKTGTISASTVRGWGVLGMILSPFAGYFVKRFGVLLLLRGSLIISVVGLVLLGVSSNHLFIIAMSVLFVAGISLIFPVIMMLIGELGGENRAIAASLYAFILFIGATLGPIVALTFIRSGNYMFTFAGLGVLLSIGLVASFIIKHD